MQTLLTYRGTVYPWHCDQMGHMNVMWYSGKFDEASWSLLAQIGITPSYLRDSQCGVAALAQAIDYKRELLAGEVVEIHSRVDEIGEKTIRFVHTMLKAENGELAATSALTAVHMDRQARRARPFPLSVRAAAEALSALPRAA